MFCLRFPVQNVVNCILYAYISNDVHVCTRKYLGIPQCKHCYILKFDFISDGNISLKDWDLHKENSHTETNQCYFVYLPTLLPLSRKVSVSLYVLQN